MADLKEEIQQCLQAFQKGNLRENAISLLGTLGYKSDKMLDIESLADLQETLDPKGFLTEQNALLSRWSAVHFLFQLTSEEIASQSTRQLNLLDNTAYDPKQIKSYLFFAIELTGDAPTRTDLSKITRALNRLVPMPVFVIFKHRKTLSLAIINRRRNLRDGTRDVLTRVSFIRNIDCLHPHRAHLDLLARFSLSGLSEDSISITSFAQLDDAWQKLLSTQELNERFYRELVDWFTWAVGEIKLAHLPDYVTDTPEHRSRATQEFTVRLICRTLFAWFLKEMGLISPELLELYDIANRPRNLLPEGDSHNDFMDGNQYYRGILQNIFFQALNRPMNQRRKSGPEAANDRTVSKPELKKLVYLGKNQLPEDFNYDLFDCIPYLNGGLFDALPEDNASDTIDDGAFRIPNKLFYARREDGFTIPGGSGRRVVNRAVEGLNCIFDRYRFTVAENTPLEEDIALDPELLGLVFENLLAEIDPTDDAASATARKASGSYYTPRRIVDYMANEALHLHLRTEFEKRGALPDDMRMLSRLCYEAPDGADFLPIAGRVVEILDAVRVLDPACGSGAFPMGMLHRMVDLLRLVDPDNAEWKRRLLSRLPTDMRADAERGMAGKSYNYLRKLGLIQKNLYGVDIQPLAALIAKLRFFLTLVIEQEVDARNRNGNYGLQPLPNLETNLLCANTLLDGEHGMISGPILSSLRTCREEYYQPQTSRGRREELALEIGGQLATLFPGFAEQTKGIKPEGVTKMDRQNMRRQQDAYWLSEWFKHATVAAPFFNVETFFPELVLEGSTGQPAAPFHIVIGNPPYGGTKIPDNIREQLGLASKDPYGAFIARFISDPRRHTPLAEGGVLAYIVSDTFMTIKTHRPLREQMMQNRIHKILRVSGDTFKATVNCAVILCQRGAPPENQTCQMADLTNVSIHEQYERFLHLLYQTEGFARRQNVSNQTYAIYHYRQSLIKTNSNLPFFVASPKLFALMKDVGNEVTVDEIDLPDVACIATLNGRDLRLFKLGDQYTGMGRSKRWLNRGLFQVMSGIKTGSNAKYLRVLGDNAQKSFERLDQSRFLDDDDAIALPEDQKLNGIVGRRCFVRFEMGMPSDADNGLLPCYYQPPSGIGIDWSRAAIAKMKNEAHSDLANAGYRFRDLSSQISFSATGIYAPTFRQSNAPIFLNKASRLFLRQGQLLNSWLAQLNSKLVRYLAKAFINHGVDLEVDDLKELPAIVLTSNDVGDQASAIISHQESDPQYDYASNEQLEIDRLVYEAYGLNEADIREVEDWYARRYPALAAAQKRNLAAKKGQTVEEFAPSPVIHLYCDESRHLPYDREPCLLMGLVSAPADSTRDLNHALSSIWKAHDMPPHFEAKWTKISPAKIAFYRELIEWFFAQQPLAFRATVLPDKQKLYAALPDDSRDYLYYRLYYQLLRSAVEPENRYRAFLDLKDTRGREKIAELRRILSDDADDETAIQSLQHIHSHEVRLAQINDILLGAVGFARRPRTDKDSTAKLELVKLIGEKAGFPLTEDSPPGAQKLILSTWHDKEALLI